jgi:hypothetical protein
MTRGNGQDESRTSQRSDAFYQGTTLVEPLSSTKIWALVSAIFLCHSEHEDQFPAFLEATQPAALRGTNTAYFGPAGAGVSPRSFSFCLALSLDGSFSSDFL